MTDYLRPSFSTATTTAPSKSRRYSQYSAVSDEVYEDEPKSGFNPFKAIKKAFKSAFSSSKKSNSNNNGGTRRRSSVAGTALRRTDTAVSYQSTSSAYSYAPSIVDQLFLPRYITPVQSLPPDMGLAPSISGGLAAGGGNGLQPKSTKTSFLLPTTSKNLSSPPVSPSITKSSGGDRRASVDQQTNEMNGSAIGGEVAGQNAQTPSQNADATSHKKKTNTLTINNPNVSITVTAADDASTENISTTIKKPTTHKKHTKEEEEDDEDLSNMLSSKDQETTEQNGKNKTVSNDNNTNNNNPTTSKTNGQSRNEADVKKPPITTSKSAPVVLNGQGGGNVAGKDSAESSQTDSDGEFNSDDEEEEEEEKINPGYKEWKRIRKEWTRGSDAIDHKESALKDVPESMYPKIYQCLVQQARPLRQPLNLADALKVIKAGWIYDGQWEAAAAASRSAVAAVAASQPKPTHRPIYGMKVP